MEWIFSGYYFIADDTIFNIWHDLSLDKFLNPREVYDIRTFWNPDAVHRSFDAFENHYKNDPRFGKSWREYKEVVSLGSLLF